ncbi:MAG TPA: HEPN domain-containing protein, partial [Anaerolineae bacterium]|nr:HEPN domain-containing protein [Anaerolineae bacterium]
MSDELQQFVNDWLTKAGNDLKIGQDEMKTSEPTTDMVCSHMRQCVGKCLKACLVFPQKPFRRTHDIAELIEQCKEINPKFDTLYQKQADTLTICGVGIRYPDDFYMPTREEAETSIETALFVREFVSSLKKDTNCTNFPKFQSSKIQIIRAIVRLSRSRR